MDVVNMETVSVGIPLYVEGREVCDLSAFEYTIDHETSDIRFAVSEEFTVGKEYDTVSVEHVHGTIVFKGVEVVESFDNQSEFVASEISEKR